MKALKFSCYALGILAVTGCKQKETLTTVVIKNTLNFDRTFETVELTKAILQVDDLDSMGIRDTESGAIQITQTVDSNLDGITDIILFQPNVPAHSEKEFEVFIISDQEKAPATTYCYSRFVPERTDDYTWENDRVAFRVFGPTAQKMVEDSIPGGTLSSGVDAWLKKVEYPIINSWYKKELETDSTYHEDTGEGLDNFHVGKSRGVGGMAVKVDDSYYYSKNYISWETITTGPIRTSFRLKYADWDASGKTIKESKIISLDRGSHLSKFAIKIEGSEHISAGLTLHEKDGKITGNALNGWVSYWQPHGESELGMAIIADKEIYAGFENYEVATKDLSHVYAHLKVKNNEVTYYAGFGWKESGHFKTSEAWEQYINNYAQSIRTPLEVSVK